MDFNSREEMIYNECIDYSVKLDPKRFCLGTIASQTPFELWNGNDIDNICSSAATSVILDCSDGECLPCANIVSFVFTRYAQFMDSETTFLYSKISEIQAALLKASNNFNTINDHVSVKIDDT